MRRSYRYESIHLFYVLSICSVYFSQCESFQHFFYTNRLDLRKRAKLVVRVPTRSQFLKPFHRRGLHHSTKNFGADESMFELRSRSWVVLVEDEEAIRLAVGDFLYKAGYSVSACADAEALLELLTGTGTNDRLGIPLPDCIICDIRIPGDGMNGLELLTILKNPPNPTPEDDLSLLRFQWKRIPVIMLTAKSLTPDRIEGYKRGADAYLPKPFAAEELLSIVDNLIRRVVEQSGVDFQERTSLMDLKMDMIDLKKILKERQGFGLDNSNEEKGLKPVRNKVLSSLPSQTQMLSPTDRDQHDMNVKLTATEQEVLELLTQGLSNGEIAEKVGVSSSMRVGKIVSNLYLKTLTRTRTELVRWAIRMGYISSK